MKAFAVLFLLSAVFLLQSSSKTVTDSESLTKFEKDPWKFMTKFAISPGKGEFKARLHFAKSASKNKALPPTVNMTLFVYLDEDWEMVRNLDTCQAKAKFARLTKPVAVPTNGSWTPRFNGFLNQKLRAHVWFFVLADCQRNVAPLMAGNRIVWELSVFNSDGSHFSQEESGIIVPLLLVIAIIVGFFISNSIKFYKFYRTEESIDYPTLIITIGLFVELLSLTCEVLHMWIYSYDGKGSFIFNFANQALSIVSQFIIACLLLLMAHGWSINFMRFRDMDIFLPLGVILGIIHVLIVGVGRITDDEHHQYHDYENWAGVFVMAMRMALYCFWIFLFRRTYSKSGRDSEKIFFNQFGLLSSLYFLALPAMVALATVIAPYARHKVITIGTLMLQTVTLVTFTLLFTTKSNKYHQISMKGRALLPSDKLD